MTTPVIVLIQTTYYGIRFSRPILLSLVRGEECRCHETRRNRHHRVLTPLCSNFSQLLVCIGVAQATNADLSTSSMGLMYAAVGVLVTAFYQIVS